MMQTEFLEPSSWPIYNIINSTYDFDDIDTLYINHDHQFSPSITTTTEDSSASASYFPVVFSGEFPSLGDEMQVSFPLGEEGIENLEFEDVCKWLDGSESIQEWSPNNSISKIDNSLMLELPAGDMELDHQSGLRHLLQAYGEAMEMGQRELTEVIKGSVKERVSQFGEPLERVAYSLFRQLLENQEEEYLDQESAKNLNLAFKAFYEIFPCGRFAHFAANSAILEAIPNDIETVHIIDFDMREGVQWAPMIEAIERTKRALRFTSIRYGEHDSGFEETKNRLFDYARDFGVKLEVEEMGIEELKGLKKRGVNGREFLAFNCMVALPHMGRKMRKRSEAIKFLNVAKGFLSSDPTAKKGVVVFGDGENGEGMKKFDRYGLFFDGYLKHYQSLYESIESNFPTYLMEARLAMESLFMSPYVSSHVWSEKWEESRQGCVFEGGKGKKISRESLMEAKEMVKEGESLYKVRIQGFEENEMVLEWKGVPLVRVSTWNR